MEEEVVRIKAKWSQRCQGICGRWLKKGRLIYRYYESWMCEDCVGKIQESEASLSQGKFL